MYKKSISIFVMFFMLTIGASGMTLPIIEAEGVMLIEPKTNTILYEKNGYQRFYPASITKILTALLIVEETPREGSIIKSKESVAEVPADSSHIGMFVGDQISVEDALYGLMAGSDNFIAHDLAIKNAGSIQSFSEKMNNRAKQSGARNTHFVNPHGYQDEGHYTTPYDMAQIAREAFDNPVVRELAKVSWYPVEVINRATTLPVYNKNRLLKKDSMYYNPYVVAAKTGYHDDAGQTLVAKAVYPDIELVAVVMKAKTPAQYTTINELFQYGSTYFKTEQQADGTHKLINKTAATWAQPSIEYAIKRGWIDQLALDYGASITLDELVVLLEQSFKKGTLTIQEVRQYLQEKGIADTGHVTRLQLAHLMKYITEKWELKLVADEAYVPLQDTKNLERQHEEVIQFVMERGLLGATEGHFSPQQRLSWQEVISATYRMVHQNLEQTKSDTQKKIQEMQETKGLNWKYCTK